MDQFVLLGDSITQQSFSQERGFGFGAALADAYVRRLDVVNRGLSGYNTAQGLRALPHCLPAPARARVRLLTIFFGANDARVPGSPGGPDQSVPLDQFAANLAAMVRHPAVRAHVGVKIILVTPPPIDERWCAQTDRARFPALDGVPRRDAVRTAAYAQAVRALGAELHVPVLDIWAAMAAHAGYTGPLHLQQHQHHEPPHHNPLPLRPPFIGSLDAPVNETLQDMLHDGLHLSGKGYRVLYAELMALIEREWPGETPTQLPMWLPTWDNVQAWRDWPDEGGAGDDGGEP